MTNKRIADSCHHTAIPVVPIPSISILRILIGQDFKLRHMGGQPSLTTYAGIGFVLVDVMPQCLLFCFDAVSTVTLSGPAIRTDGCAFGDDVCKGEPTRDRRGG